MELKDQLVLLLSFQLAESSEKYALGKIDLFNMA